MSKTVGVRRWQIKELKKLTLSEAIEEQASRGRVAARDSTMNK